MPKTLRAALAAGLVWLAVTPAAAQETDEQPAPTSAQENFNAPDGSSFTCEPFDPSCDQPLWTVTAGAVILQRSRPDHQRIVVPTAGPGTVGFGDDFRFTPVAGPDISIARRFASGNSVQVRYFGALDWSSVTAYGAVGNVRIGSFSNFGATDLSASYSSRLNSTEINWLRPVSDRFTFLAGFRQIELHDVVNYHIVFPAFNADYNWNVDNHLYGGQIGGNFNLWRLDGPLSVTAAVKAGAFGNSADNDFSLRPSTGGLFTGGGNASKVTFVGELNLLAHYHFTPNIAVRGGYQLLWIDGAALASNQAAASTAASSQALIDTSGGVFYNGAMVGFEFLR